MAAARGFGRDGYHTRAAGFASAMAERLSQVVRAGTVEMWFGDEFAPLLWLRPLDLGDLAEDGSA